MQSSAATYTFTPFPELQTPRLHLRQLRVDDEEEIFSIRSDARVNKYLARSNYTSREESRNFIAGINAAISANKALYWGITRKEEDMVIGTICLWNFVAETNEAEIGYELHPDAQGQGIMQEAYETVVDFAFNVLGLQKLVAVSARNNNRSVRLLMKNGFGDPLPYTENGESVPDVMIYQLNKND